MAFSTSSINNTQGAQDSINSIALAILCSDSPTLQDNNLDISNSKNGTCKSCAIALAPKVLLHPGIPNAK